MDWFKRENPNQKQCLYCQIGWTVPINVPFKPFNDSKPDLNHDSVDNNVDSNSYTDFNDKNGHHWMVLSNYSPVNYQFATEAMAHRNS